MPNLFYPPYFPLFNLKIEYITEATDTKSDIVNNPKSSIPFSSDIPINIIEKKERKKK